MINLVFSEMNLGVTFLIRKAKYLFKKIVMLHHIVMWTLKDYAEGNSKKENALLMKAGFEKLLPSIKEIKKLEVGINMRSSQYANFDIVLDTWFENYDEMEIYQKHPLHIEISGWIRKIRKTRAAVDYEI